MHSKFILKSWWIDTPLGSMVAISDDKNLYLLEFIDRHGLEKNIKLLGQRAVIISEYTQPIAMIREELELYFLGKLKSFKTPLCLVGSEFQQKAWHALTQIPYAQTRSYKRQAEIVGNEKACRAVAKANSSNQLAIIIPCHRVICYNGEFGGYSAGRARKEWLINHESCYA